ncbi:hypothetical protein INR49_022449 [Caranx melampygus]|nr:hypothetical protein INR49_022449 [Caranx melampygus]
MLKVATSPSTDMAVDKELKKPVERSGRLTAVLALATLISAFGSSFQYGYNVAVINSPHR